MLRAGDDELKTQYDDECASMASRISAMRSLLKEELVKAGSKKNWDHITSQIGMFAYTGMTAEMCDELMEK